MIETIFITGNGGDLADVYSIRHQVFVLEQNVPSELEKDEYDKHAEHCLVLFDGQIAGTGRIYRDADDSGLAIMGRIAVLSDFRGKGLGKIVINELINVARKWNCHEIVIHSQIQVEKLYQKIGFVSRGDLFEDAGIMHIEMFMSLAEGRSIS